jgi:hypothetical protein
VTWWHTRRYAFQSAQLERVAPVGRALLDWLTLSRAARLPLRAIGSVLRGWVSRGRKGIRPPVPIVLPRLGGRRRCRCGGLLRRTLLILLILLIGSVNALVYAFLSAIFQAL